MWKQAAVKVPEPPAGFCLFVTSPWTPSHLPWSPGGLRRCRKGSNKDKPANWKLVQQKVRSQRSAESLSDGKSRESERWLHSIIVF